MQATFRRLSETIVNRGLALVLLVCAVSWPTQLGAGWHADYIATLPTQAVRVVDADGQPVAGVNVGRGLRIHEADDGWAGGSGGALRQWSWSEDGRTASVTDADGVARIRVADHHLADGQTISIYVWDPYGGRVALAEYAADDLRPERGTPELRLEPGCRVGVDFASATLEAQDTPLYDTTVYLSWGGHEILLMHQSTQRRASFFLPPGEYGLRMFGYGRGLPIPGSGGVPTQELKQTIDIKPGDSRLDLGTLDLPPTDQGRLFGKPAPALGPMTFWKNSEPLTLDMLEGKVVVLLFWSRHCGSAATVPVYADLIRDRLGTEYLEIIAIHEADEALKDQAAFDHLVQPSLDEAAAGYRENGPTEDPGTLDLPIAVEVTPGEGEILGPTGRAYRQESWPTGLIIGTDGRLLHRMHYGVEEHVIRAAVEAAEAEVNAQAAQVSGTTP